MLFKSSQCICEQCIKNHRNKNYLDIQGIYPAIVRYTIRFLIRVKDLIWTFSQLWSNFLRSRIISIIPYYQRMKYLWLIVKVKQLWTYVLYLYIDHVVVTFCKSNQGAHFMYTFGFIKYTSKIKMESCASQCYAMSIFLWRLQHSKTKYWKILHLCHSLSHKISKNKINLTRYLYPKNNFIESYNLHWLLL